MKPLFLLPLAAHLDSPIIVPIHNFHIHGYDIDPWELHVFLVELRDWALTGQHHMHKGLQFETCQQALEWLALARVLSNFHGSNCLFYLGHVGDGRIETDILNWIDGRLTRDDLSVARMLNSLERKIKCRVAHASTTAAP